jgi:hypothetical protein
MRRELVGVNLTVYLDAEELEYVKSRGPGFVRSLVRASMTGPASDDADAPERSTPAAAFVSPGAQVARRVRGERSACCGGMLLAGKCQICGAKARPAG